MAIRLGGPEPVPLYPGCLQGRRSGYTGQHRSGERPLGVPGRLLGNIGDEPPEQDYRLFLVLHGELDRYRRKRLLKLVGAVEFIGTAPVHPLRKHNATGSWSVQRQVQRERLHPVGLAVDNGPELVQVYFGAYVHVVSLLKALSVNAAILFVRRVASR